MQVAERAGARDTILVLEQNMKEEQSIADWIVTHTPAILDKLWPKIQAAVTK
jgi:ferritin-like metal-binding protein YciE